MKLDLSQIKEITGGAVRIEEEEDGVHFYRFTKKQEDLYWERSQKKKNDFHMKSLSTSGIQMRFLTDSPSLFLNVEVKEATTRRYFSLEVFVNGKRIDAIKNFNESELVGNYTKKKFPLGNFSKAFPLGAGEKEVRIYFPWSVKLTLKELLLSDGSLITPVKPKKKLLCFGDSISQGYDVLYPSNKYATKIAELLDAQEYNKAIGGEIFIPPLPAIREDFDPDYVIVAYGSNDWSKCTQEQLTQHCSEFFKHVCHHYSNAKIFAITPIWRKDMHSINRFGDFMRAEEIIREQAAAFEEITVIRGFEFVPQEESLFADLKLHPNDRGYEFYVENLWKPMKAQLEQ